MEMTAYYGVTRSTYYLEHHGVKGQRWGVRRYQNKDGSLTAAGKRHIQNAVNATADMVKRHIPSPEKRAAAAKARQARKEQKAAEKRQRELDSYKTDPRKRLKNMNQLTNAELKELKERIELENRVTDLTREQLEKPKKMADMVLGYAKTGVDIAKTIADGYDAIQTFKAMANGTRANGKNLVGDELVKFLDAKEKLAGGKSNSDSDNSSSKDSGGKKKDKGSSNSDSDSGSSSSSDSSTGIYGGKKKNKGGEKGGKNQTDQSTEEPKKDPRAGANPNQYDEPIGPQPGRAGANLNQYNEPIGPQPPTRKEQRAADKNRMMDEGYANDPLVKAARSGARASADTPTMSKVRFNNPRSEERRAEARAERFTSKFGKSSNELTHPTDRDAESAERASRQSAEAYRERQTARAERFAQRLREDAVNRERARNIVESPSVSSEMSRPANSNSAARAAAEGKAAVDRFMNASNAVDDLTADLFNRNGSKL